MPKSDIFPNQYLSDMNDVLWANGIYDRRDIQWYSKFHRLRSGVIDPFNAPSGCKEYLFFTKPDLNIVNPPDSGLDPMALNPELANQPYFQELLERYPDVISQLQFHNGIGDQGPFMAVLSNSVKSTLELPEISANTIETAQNIYGTSYNYRGWGYSSDEKVEFVLEFEDTRYLEIYNLIKAYEEYERLKRLGQVSPPNIDGTPRDKYGRCFSYYIRNKILHDQFSIYKFIVEDDGETIMYYAKLWGVFFKNVPRETFSDLKVDNGITYSVNFEAAFVDDMNPTILTDFNQLVTPHIKNTQDLPIYDTNKGMIDGSWAKMPIVTKVPAKNNSIWPGPSNMDHIYKLKWRK